MPRSTPRLLPALLCGALLSGCSMMPDLSSSPKDKVAAAKPDAVNATTAQGDIDGNVRQAHLLRLAGQYDEAIAVLSQLMLVASDDPRVVAEYGKTLAQKGRASDATQFLRRAVELSPNDWTLYSALGVAYDQVNDPANARAAYEHALALKPGDATVLNNYALSRMLAKDPEGAKFLIAKAQASAQPGDTKIADNVKLIASMAPADGKADDKAAPKADVKSDAVAAAKPAPSQAKPAQAVAANAPRPLQSTAQSAPRPLTASAPAPQNPTPKSMAAVMPQVAAAQAAPLPAYPPTVVMQKVPVDPLAGPVAVRKTKPKAVAKADKPATDAKPEAQAKAQAASAKKDDIPALRVAADHY